MKILCVNSVISKYGGAEFAAMNLALGLSARGHEIHYLGGKAQIAQQCHGQDERGKINLHYREFPRTYPLGEKHGKFRKLVWHIQDIAHPTNELLFADALRQIRPDAIILHNVTAIGWNIWRTVRKSRIPCTQVIHDLGLICLNKSRFRGGRQCAGLCVACRIQTVLRFSMINASTNLSFVSPSRATLEEIQHYVDLSAWRREVISNPNVFDVKQRNVSSLEGPRLLYVGQLESLKGIEVLLQSARIARKQVKFNLDILGSGSLEGALRERYANEDWIKFHGNVNQPTVAEFMSHATVLLVPSLWHENAPSVVIHALFANLPVLASRTGGIPEHIVDGQTGRLLPPGDQSAWTAEITRVVNNRDQVAAWSAACTVAAKRFDPELMLGAYERVIQEMIVKSLSSHDNA
jgi:glycosyltransferase involved in cell wall biosynthesis